MAKQNLLLNTPIVRPNGLTQTHVAIDYVYIHEDEFVVYTVQGNVISIPVDPDRQNFLINLENASKAVIDP